MLFPFLDNLAITGKRQIGLAMAGGAVFNLANLLLVAAISVAGLSVAFPVGIGLALIEGAVLNYIIHPAGHPALVFGGVALVLMGDPHDFARLCGAGPAARPRGSCPRRSLTQSSAASGPHRGGLLPGRASS